MTAAPCDFYLGDCTRCGKRADRDNQLEPCKPRHHAYGRQPIAVTAPPARTYAEGDWRPIAEFDMADTGPTKSVIVAVTCEGREPVVGEAYFDEGAYGGTWWWAGLSQDGYYDSHIEDMQHGKVTHFHPMPTFPAIHLLSQGEKA